MQYRTVTERVGEWLGPIDKDYDFGQEGWNPPCDSRIILLLAAIIDPKTLRPEREVKYRSDTGAVFDVALVGMYDGWPYWKPTPAIGYIVPLSCLEIAFCNRLDAGSIIIAPA